MEIDTYEPKSESMKPYAVFDLFKRTIGRDWQISQNEFTERIFGDESADVNSRYAVLREGENILGFIAFKYKASGDKPKGQIALILVDQSYQRQGWGTKLIEHALSEMKQAGVYDVQLGAGAGSYLWPGVPENLPKAQAFFTSQGWTFTEDSIDMIGDIRKYSTPVSVSERLDPSVTFRYPDAGMKDALLAFEQEHFPEWYEYFKKHLDDESWETILVAVNQDNEILGSTLVTISKFTWQEMFDGPVGSIGTLGVSKQHRGKGIGLALAARATELLKERRASYCFLGWTYLADWYKKLGYEVWREYKISRLTIQK